MGDVSDSVANWGHGLVPFTVLLSTIQVGQNEFWHSLFCIKIYRVTLILWLLSALKKEERRWKPVQITGAWRPGYIAYVFVLLSGTRCNYVVVCCVGDTCGQRPSCLRRSLFRFRTVPLVGPLLLGGGQPKKKLLGPEPAVPGHASYTDSLFVIYMSYRLRLAMKNVTMPYS